MPPPDDISLDSAVRVPLEVMAREVGDETVILHLASGTYFGLDPVGTRMWALIREGLSAREVCRTMLSKYDVEAGQLEADLLSLLRDLREAGLIEIA